MSTPSSAPRARAPFAVAFLAVLAACAPIRRNYTEPTAGKLARVRVSTDGIVWLIPNNKCVDYRDPRSGLGPVAQGAMFSKALNDKKMGMPGTGPRTAGLQTSELAVQAEEPVVLSYGHETSTSTGRITTTYTCKLNFVFTPKQGYDYAALSETTPDGRRCRMGVVAIGDKSGPFGKAVAIQNQYDKPGCEKVEEEAAHSELKSPEGEATATQ